MADAMFQPMIGEPDEAAVDCVETEETQSEQFRSDRSSAEHDEEFENLVNTLMHDKDYISVNQAALNITYTIINAGLIAIPFTAFNAGIPLFIAVIVLMSIISCYVAIMVISMANQKRVRTLEDLAESVGGPGFFLCVCAFQILFSFSMMCVTLNIWSDVMSDVFSGANLHGVMHHIFATRRGEVLVGALIVLPLCVFKRSMISLRWTAYLTVCAVAFCLCAVVIAYFAHSEGPSLDTSATDLVTPQSQWWTVMFVVVFCFSYNQRVFAVYRCLKRRSTERWTSAVRKASVSVTVLYLLFGIAGYLTMARKGIKMDNFNFFLDDRGENVVLFNIARVVVVSSLLLTIPVDSLIASSTWRRLYGRYLKLTRPKYHHPSDTSGSSASARRRYGGMSAGSGCQVDDAVQCGKADPALDDTLTRPYTSEETRPNTNSVALSHSSSTSTANEYGFAGQLVLSSKDAAIVTNSGLRTPSQAMPSGEAVLLEQQRRSLACSPPQVTLSHLDMLMNEPLPGQLRPVLSASNLSAAGVAGGAGVSVGAGAAAAGTGGVTLSAGEDPTTDRRSFTSTGTGRASSTTGSGVAGHRMLSKEEMESILRANSFDTKSKKSKSQSQHEQDAAYDAEQEGMLNDSWQSNMSLSYDSHGPRGLNGGSSHKLAMSISEWHNRYAPLVLWLLCALTCFGVNRWMYIAATIGTLSTTMLLFIFPTMFYFRMTLASDYSATPLCGRLVPNALYMGVIQALGIVIMLCDLLAIVYLPITGAHIIRDET